MKAYNKYASLQGNLVMVGFGSIGQAVLPLLFRHLEIHPKQIRIISVTCCQFSTTASEFFHSKSLQQTRLVLYDTGYFGLGRGWPVTQ